MTAETIAQAVEITKSALVSHNANWIGLPENVTKFIETVAKKIDELKNPATR